VVVYLEALNAFASPLPKTTKMRASPSGISIRWDHLFLRRGREGRGSEAGRDFEWFLKVRAPRRRRASPALAVERATELTYFFVVQVLDDACH
jgi:hypothetical protein